MKRLLLGLSCAVLLGSTGTLPVASAQGWWWHHKGPGPAGVGSTGKSKTAKTHREKPHHDKTEPLHKFPKSIGRWHKSPGPEGAGVK